MLGLKGKMKREHGHIESQVMNKWRHSNLQLRIVLTVNIKIVYKN